MSLHKVSHFQMLGKVLIMNSPVKILTSLRLLRLVLVCDPKA